MSSQHSRMPGRAARNPRLKQPTRQQPAFCEIALVSGKGTRWQSKQPVALNTTSVRYDLNGEPGKLPPEALDDAANRFLGLSAQEPALRKEIGQRLAAGDYRDVQWTADATRDLPKLADPAVVERIRPYFVADF